MLGHLLYQQVINFYSQNEDYVKEEQRLKPYPRDIQVLFQEVKKPKLELNKEEMGIENER
jgi:hypothetical protein